MLRKALAVPRLPLAEVLFLRALEMPPSEGIGLAEDYYNPRIGVNLD